MYVALYYSDKTGLGRTILCSAYADAVAACVALAEQQGDYKVKGDRLQELELDGQLQLNNGGYVHIGLLEESDN